MTTKTTTEPLTFTIDGEEKELKLTFAAAKYLNGLYEGGSLELVAKALLGDLETFPHLIYAATMHLDESLTMEFDIETAIEEAIIEERLSMKEIMRLSNRIIRETHFYKELTATVLNHTDEMGATIDRLIS